MNKCRMISDAVVRNESFLRMSAGAQTLYFHLCIEADDEGFVSAAGRFAKMLGFKVATLRELVDNGFLIFFEQSSVAVICHWFLNNKLKKDRIKETLFNILSLSSLISDS